MVKNHLKFTLKTIGNKINQEQSETHAWNYSQLTDGQQFICHGVMLDIPSQLIYALYCLILLCEVYCVIV